MSIWPCLFNLPHVFLPLYVAFVHICVSVVGGGIGGLENVRNVEECNQNVLLCGKQQQQKKTQGDK